MVGTWNVAGSKFQLRFSDTEVDEFQQTNRSQWTVEWNC